MTTCTVCPLPQPTGHIAWLLKHRDHAHPAAVARVIYEPEKEVA